MHNKLIIIIISFNNRTMKIQMHLRDKNKTFKYKILQFKKKENNKDNCNNLYLKKKFREYNK